MPPWAVATVVVFAIIAVLAMLRYNQLYEAYEGVVKERKRLGDLLKLRPIDTLWDAEPICPYCGTTNEAIFALQDHDKWSDLDCVKCDKDFFVKPQFALSCIVSATSRGMSQKVDRM